MLLKNLKTISIALSSLWSASVLAQGIVLNDPDLRTDLNWLNQQGVIQMSTSTWPMSGEEIRRVLFQAEISNNTQQKVVDAVVARLNANNKLLKASLFAETDQKNIPQAFGDQQKAQYQAGLELNAGNQNWDAKVRVNVEKDLQIDNGQDVNVEGSYIAAKLWNQWLIAGQIPTYWGPGQDGSLIRGDVSRPVYGFTMQRAEQRAFESKWLSWIGSWQYQAFAGKLDNYDTVPDTQLLGLRLTAQPLPYLELGASRAWQIAGKDQPDSLKAYWNAFIGKDNECNADGCRGEGNASNQLAGLDARLNLKQWANIPVSVYGQFVGEDESGLMPSRKMYLAGLDYSGQVQNMPFQVYTEWADTRTNGEVKGYSYNHHIYWDGYYQHGFPLGHAMGGDGQMYSLGGSIHLDRVNRLNARMLIAKLNQSNLDINHVAPQADELKGIDLTWTHYARQDVPVKMSAWLSDSDVSGQDSGFSLGIELPLDGSLLKW